MGQVSGYRTAVRRLLDGSEDGRKVMVRTPLPNGPMEVLDGEGWRPVRPADRFFAATRNLPQVENDWVR
jgi:hypothetical protein